MSALLALVSSLCWGTADFLGGTTTRRLPSALVVLLSQSFGLIYIVGVAVIARSWGDPTGYWPWAVLASCAGVSGLVAFYQALAIGTMGVVAPIAGLAGLVPLAAGLLAGERFGSVAAVGAAAILLGVVLASGPELHSDAGAKPLALAILAAVLFGVSLLGIARGSDYSPVMTMVGMRVTAVFVLCLALLIMSARHRAQPRSRETSAQVRAAAPALIAIGILDVSANLTYGLSAASGLLVATAVLGSLYPVATALLAAVVHHERLRAIQYVGVAFAVAGLALVSLG
mgnify:FL=1